jgi:hypothetical protein
MTTGGTTPGGNVAAAMRRRTITTWTLNLRTYDAAKQTWNMKWLNALAGTWVDLGPEELGGVNFDGRSIIYAFREPVAGHAYTRATYANISDQHFTWEGRSLTTERSGASSWWLRSIEALSSPQCTSGGGHGHLTGR